MPWWRVLHNTEDVGEGLVGCPAEVEPEAVGEGAKPFAAGQLEEALAGGVVRPSSYPAIPSGVFQSWGTLRPSLQAYADQRVNRSEMFHIGAVHNDLSAVLPFPLLNGEGPNEPAYYGFRL